MRKIETRNYKHAMPVPWGQEDVEYRPERPVIVLKNKAEKHINLNGVKLDTVAPFIIFPSESNIVEFENRNYYLIEQDKEADTITLLELDNPQLTLKIISYSENINSLRPTNDNLKVVNETIRKYNKAVGKILEESGLSANNIMTVLPRCVSALDAINERLQELEQQKIHFENKYKKDSTTSFSDIEASHESLRQRLLNGELAEEDVIDTALYLYQNKYDKLLQDVNQHFNGNPAMKQRLIELAHEALLSEQSDRAKQQKYRAKRRDQAENIDAEPPEMPLAPISEMGADELESKPSAAMKFRSLDKFINQSKAIVKSIEENIEFLKNTKNGIQLVRDQIVQAAGWDQNKTNTLDVNFFSTPQGQKLLASMTDCLKIAATFLKKYSVPFARDGKIDKRFFGNRGTLGNTLVIFNLNRMYYGIKKCIELYRSRINQA